MRRGRPDGQRRTALAHANPIHDEEGKLIGAVNVLVDISQRIETERALRDARDGLARQVRKRTAALTKLSQHLIQLSEDEKARLAIEVHDDFGSILTLLSLKIGDLGRRLAGADPDVVDEHREISRLLAAVIARQRRLVRDLRPILLVTFGLAIALHHYVADWTRSSGLDAQIDLAPHLPHLDMSLALALYRVVQQSLTNVTMHAKASRVRVTLSVNRSELRLTIEDDGVGIPKKKVRDPNSHGLLGMRERIARFGGLLTVGAGEGGHGTRVTSTVRVRASAQAHLEDAGGGRRSNAASSMFQQNTYTLSHTEVKLVPTENDRGGVELINTLEDARLEFINRRYSDVAQEGSGHL